MLAVLPPSMGSSKPLNHDSPFGYEFDNTEFPLPSPTAPAPGPSLLDENEFKTLENFFNGMDNDADTDMFSINPSGGSEIPYWDLPPQFMGTTSSFGHQPVIGNNGFPEHGFGDFNLPMNTGPSIPPSTSEDVLAAATVLQNGSTGRSHSMGEAPLFGDHGILGPPMNGNMRTHSVSRIPRAGPSHGLPQRQSGQTFYEHGYYRDMVFGGDPEAANKRRVMNSQVEIQWGSDTGFASPQGFNSSDRDKIAAAERSHLQIVDSAFTIDTSNLNSSADNTRPSSPAHQRTKSLIQNMQEEQDSRPKKRRKSNFPEEDEEAKPSSSMSKPGPKKRRPTKKSQDESPPETSEQGSGKRRKSAAANAAAAKARENLTEDQKRENHIKSEQKRRTLIREGFEDLGELVPGLKGGGFSKSAVLIMAADWLEELLAGNRELKERLNGLEGRS